VISTATTDPFSQVMRGDFLADLYYRLNVVRIDVDLLNVP
jgi:DNA-binding NtrC family response regulator